MPHRLGSQGEASLSLSWVHSEGGPILLLADILRPSWAGTHAPSPRRSIEATFDFQVTDSATDYDRARHAGHERLGVLSVGSGQGLVLGHVALQTTWLPEERGPGGWLVRREQGKSDAAVERTLVRSQVTEWTAGPIFHSIPGPHYLFDAARSGTEITEADALLIALPAPMYRISTGFLRPDSNTSLIVHRLEA